MSIALAPEIADSKPDQGCDIRETDVLVYSWGPRIILSIGGEGVFMVISFNKITFLKVMYLEILN